MIASAIDAGISAYVVDGLRKERVKPILDLAIRRFNAFARMQAELDACIEISLTQLIHDPRAQP
jgi:response regulator NasT